MAKKKTASLLTLEDVAFLYDGLRDDLPEGLAARLNRWVRQDPQFADQIRQLTSIAAEAGLPGGKGNRLTEALELELDLERLLTAGDDWQDPAEVLDPDGGQGIDLAGLANLAHSAERRQDPPAAIGDVHGKLVRALAALAAEAALVDAFVEGLLECPERAGSLLREAKEGFLARAAAKPANSE
ncbi:MAG: hypothetical protein V3T72_12945 [Thermoanaerobaculia bacterium]